LKNLNFYDLYRPVYPDSELLLQSANRLGVSYVNGEAKTYKRGFTMQEYTPWLKSSNAKILRDGTTDYVNRPDVRKAMNIPDSVQAWEMCTGNIGYYPQQEGSYWIYSVLRY
jgi:hypothetical protein